MATAVGRIPPLPRRGHGSYELLHIRLRFPPSTPVAQRHPPLAVCRSSGRVAAAAAAAPLNCGGGGARDTRRRAPPFQALDSDPRVQGDGFVLRANCKQVKKVAAVSSCGSTAANHLLPLPLPLPCVGDPTSVSRVSPGTSPARSDASEGAAAFYAEPEASAFPSSSYDNCAAWSAGSLTAHRPASPSPICSPVSSKGGDGCRDGGERRDDGDTSSFVTSQQVQELAIDAVNEWRLPKVSEEEDEAVDQKDWQDDTLSSRVSLARDWNFESDSAYEGSNHDGRAFDHSEVEDCAAAVQRMDRAAFRLPICSPVSSKGSDGCRDGGERRDDGDTSSFVTSQQEQELAIDAVNEWRLPKVSEEEDEAVDQDWQDDTLSSRVSSARDWNFESDNAYEGSNHDDRVFDYSEVEDCAAAVQRMERRLQGSAMKQEDAQIEMLIDKLNQKEAQVDQWQKNKIN